MENKIFFENSKGDKLCAILSNPTNDIKKPIIIVCHGFHSHKNRPSLTSISSVLNKNGISTLRLDFYGHGESEGEFENITISEAVDDILHAINYLKKLDYKKIGLFGSSFGGISSIMAASKTKDLYLLALRSPVSNYEEVEKGRMSRKEIELWREKGYRIYEDDPNEKVNYIFFEDFKNNNGYMAALKIKIPTLIVHGDKDINVPIEQSLKTSKLIPNCKLIIVKGADHNYTNENHFKQMVKTITDFIIEQSYKQ